MPRVNTVATQARDDYQNRPYSGPRPEVWPTMRNEAGAMSGGFAETRDSDALERSNFRQALAAYQAAGVEVSVDHFGHWAVGWIDYLTVVITPASVAVLTDLLSRVENYPALNDEDWSELEWEDNHSDPRFCYDREAALSGGCGCELPYVDDYYASGESSW